MQKRSVVVVAILAAALVGVANLTLAFRDGTLTTSMPSFRSSEIIQMRLWKEAPMQVLHTFMGANSSMLFVGQPTKGGLAFADRIRNKLGENQVDSVNAPVDLRSRLGAEDLSKLMAFVNKLSYRSAQPCPHNPADECVIAVGWNRERPKEAGIRWLATRISDDTYLIVDESILNVE